MSMAIPESGFLRLNQIIGPVARPIPISKSAWWQGIKDGRFPKPIKLGPRTTAWKAQDIKALVDRLAAA